MVLGRDMFEVGLGRKVKCAHDTREQVRRSGMQKVLVKPADFALYNIMPKSRGFTVCGFRMFSC